MLIDALPLPPAVKSSKRATVDWFNISRSSEKPLQQSGNAAQISRTFNATTTKPAYIWRKMRLTGAAAEIVTARANAPSNNTTTKRSAKNVMMIAHPRAVRTDIQSTSTPEETEMTIAIPKFTMDSLGNWLYNPWAATFGNIFKDTRFLLSKRFTVPRLRIHSNIVTNYYPPSRKLSTVCMTKSTAYTVGKVEAWLGRHVYNKTHSQRPIYLELRREMYELGRSEECHTAEFNTWKSYIECAVLRNQRMESRVPHYPFHQIIEDHREYRRLNIHE
ncbi:uncharacterized protein LOC115634173 isoform X2 [Scaptodrosophila lebanonensis]|uniref:Uncharacterized protein LOC115634173 isoform X2 n=1 Tax=Drosophila lebanonensis TaxID=7225 RepID=A0A6J2UGR7_DROLE|nr:uncharacterized protein LOC115634173 isoform X2 [Scaptodrosophila lebanonensis]